MTENPIAISCKFAEAGIDQKTADAIAAVDAYFDNFATKEDIERVDKKTGRFGGSIKNTSTKSKVMKLDKNLMMKICSPYKEVVEKVKKELEN